MIDHAAVWRAHQRARFMRPDAYRWIRPDAVRFLKPGTDPADVYPALDRKYNPTQRRIPRGQPGGGRWTDGEGDSGGFEGANPFESTDESGGGEDNVTTDATPLAFQDGDNSGSMDDWNALLGQLADDKPQPIPNANPDDAEANTEDVTFRRGGGPYGNYFPGASAEQQARLDQAIARSENALTQVRQYDPNWKPRVESVMKPEYGAEAAINRAEARAVETEVRLDQLRNGIGGNFAPPLNPPPRTGLSARVFDGGAWIDAYRTINNAPDLFGRPSWPLNDGTVAVTKVNESVYFGLSSGAPGYTTFDRIEAVAQRWNMIGKYDVMNRDNDNIGGWPNDGLFHAEANGLMRVARDTSLVGKEIEVYVDRSMCITMRCRVTASWS